MSIAEDINSFKIWAAKLGCPLEKIPTDEYLKSVFREKQGIIFKQFMEKVLCRTDVKKINDNVLICRVQKHKNQGNVTTLSNRKSIPQELARYDKITKYNAKISETEKRIANSKGQVETLSSLIKAKNIKKHQLKTNLKAARNKIALYEAKDAHLWDASQKENVINQKLDTIMPVKGCNTNTNESNAKTAIETCLKYLNEFYSTYTLQKQDGSKQAQLNLWKNMKIALRNIPNNQLWNVLMAIKEEQLQHISELGEKRINSDKNGVEINIGKLCAFHINMFIKLMAIRQATDTTKNDYISKYNQFEQILEAKMDLLNVNDEGSNGILEYYIVQINSSAYNQGKIDFITKETENKKRECYLNAQKLANHEQLCAQLREIYNETDSISSRMQEELAQLYQIKERIVYTKEFTHYTIQNMRLTANPNTTSFYNNNSMNSSNITMPPPSLNTTVIPLAPHVTELQLFGEIATQKFNKTTKTFLFSLGPHVVLTSALSAMASMLPGHLLTTEGSLQEIRRLVDLDEVLMRFVGDNKPEIDLNEVDENYFKTKQNENHDIIVELLDQISTVAVVTEMLINKARQYYQFELDNSLRKYVPSTKLFNGRNYREYEAQYIMYYRMINEGN